jgi:hypothetical protein
VDDETKNRVELYTDWLKEWVRDLPGQITVAHRPAAHRSPYQWAIYRGNSREKVRVLHPDSAFLVNLSTAEARQFLHQALKIKLMYFVPDTCGTPPSPEVRHSRVRNREG